MHSYYYIIYLSTAIYCFSFQLLVHQYITCVLYNYSTASTINTHFFPPNQSLETCLTEHYHILSGKHSAKLHEYCVDTCFSFVGSSAAHEYIYVQYTLVEETMKGIQRQRNWLPFDEKKLFTMERFRQFGRFPVYFLMHQIQTTAYSNTMNRYYNIISTQI